MIAALIVSRLLRVVQLAGGEKGWPAALFASAGRDLEAPAYRLMGEVGAVVRRAGSPAGGTRSGGICGRSPRG
jgi:hypothetical protein